MQPGGAGQGCGTLLGLSPLDTDWELEMDSTLPRANPALRPPTPNRNAPKHVA